jgi:bacterioferritin
LPSEVAIETYRDMVRHFGDNDPTTRVVLERILAQEEEHANDMHDLLVSHEGRPMLQPDNTSKTVKRIRRIA